MIEQGSPEWFAQRAGKVTASRIADVMAKTKTGYGASRANYMAELLVERMTGLKTERYQSAEMRWGIETEPQARDAYSFIMDAEVLPAEFTPHPSIAWTGASPDGLVGADGLVEIKCPNTASHIDTLLTDAIPNQYVLQMQWQMACTGRLWCDYVSFDPRMPGDMQFYRRRLLVDADHIGRIENEVRSFLLELACKHDSLITKYRAAA